MNWLIYIGGWYLIVLMYFDIKYIRGFFNWFKCSETYAFTAVWIWICWKFIH